MMQSFRRTEVACRYVTVHMLIPDEPHTYVVWAMETEATDLR